MREAIVASLTNVILFACWVGVPTASPQAAEFNPRAFGERPLGYPVTEFVFVLLAVLYLPLIPAVCGLTRLGVLRVEEDHAAQQKNWERVEWLRGQRRPAARLARFGLWYFLALFVVWIAWTTYKGV